MTILAIDIVDYWPVKSKRTRKAQVQSSPATPQHVAEPTSPTANSKEVQG